MANLSAIRIRYEPLRVLAFGDISTTYEIVGTPFQNPIRLIKFINETNQGITISFDGVYDYDYIPAGSGQVYDYCTNKSDQGGSLEQSEFDRVYVKTASSPTSGSVYVTCIYASVR
jgi:hypothetical protein